jgi:hypothetical protein
MEIAAEFTAAVVLPEPAFITKPVVAASVTDFVKPLPEIVIA